MADGLPPPIGIESVWFDSNDTEVDVIDCFLSGDGDTWLVELDDGELWPIGSFLDEFTAAVPA